MSLSGEGFEEQQRNLELSVAEQIAEAMNTPAHPPPHQRPTTTRDLPPPHLPLRESSAQALRSRHAPTPIFAPPQQQRQQQQHYHTVRGFTPSPAAAAPQVASVTASSEHAFAGRRHRRPSKLPLGSVAGHEQSMHNGAPSPAFSDRDFPRPPSSPFLPPPPSPFKPPRLRGSKSIGEGLRGLRQRISSDKSIPLDGRDTPDSVGTDEPRQSFRSAFTSHSSYLKTSSINTDHSSYADANSSTSEFVHLHLHSPDAAEERRASMTVDDAIGMYEEGFESARQSMDTYGKRSFQADRASARFSAETRGRRSLQLERPAATLHRRSQSASLLARWTPPVETVPVSSKNEVDHAVAKQSPPTGGPQHSALDGPAGAEPLVPTPPAAPVPRDRYGFKKASHYITVEQYDAWDATYSEHIERRSKKWHALMESYGFRTDPPTRFPPKNEKIKRYIRKGIPADLRGAAWFFYAGGPARLAKQPGLYQRLLKEVEGGKLSDNDREHIARDLNRTFPDNIRFKPDATTMSDVQAGAGGGKKSRGSNTEPETSIVKALRRVLQAFAVHNPSIGYCQSLNFIAGLLLLFLDEDEEKSFILLEIVTSIHLPGTHSVALEGANIDIAVLMSCIKESLPAIWEKLDDKGGSLVSDPSAQALRLPTVSLATTAWFMSLFVGTLPIESVLRIWDCLFFEGSRTLFRVALAIFKAGEKQILAITDPMEIFQVVQTIPRGMLDVNGLMEVCFRRRGGFAHVSQEMIERRREERRRDVKAGVAGIKSGVGMGERLRGRWRSRTKV